jgi:Na+-transporting methylmalonyl-CoA/oxaloacetate decarboxylase gamma subunit
MKNISVLLILVLVIGLVSGCSPAAETDDNVEPEETDIVTTASVTDDKETFKAAMGADGT